MCNIMNGLVPVSSLLLIRLLPCRNTSGSACVTGIVAANISWGRRWHCCVAATTRLWRSRFTISRSESPPLPTRCGVRFSLLLLPLPPSVCPLDDLAPFISLSFGCKLSPSPLLLEGGLTRKGGVPCLGVWIIEFIIQLNEELFERMAEGHAGPSNDAGRRAPRCE